MEKLNEIRNEIDNIDKELVKLFEKRMKLVEGVADYKIEKGMSVFDASREDALINKTQQYLTERELEEDLKLFFLHLMDISKAYQRNRIESLLPEDTVIEKSINTIGYSGIAGSFTEEAAIQYFGNEVPRNPYNSYEDCFIALANEQIDYAVIPIENSWTGANKLNYTLLRKYGCFICGEVVVKIEQNLLGVKGATINDIKSVYSHVQGIEQCDNFLAQYNWEKIPYYNTATSAKFVKGENDKSKAAIASKRAMEIYDLEILEEKINSDSDNHTRFVIVGKKLQLAKNANKVSIVFSTLHKAGELFLLLREFAEGGINLLSIMSLPVISKPWEYFFYIDFEGNLNSNQIKEVLSKVRSKSNYFKILGNYRAGKK